VPIDKVRVDAGQLAGLLADPDRRRVLAAIELGARTHDAIIDRSGLAGAAGAKALGRLVDGGLVRHGDGGFEVDGEAIQSAAREARRRPASSEHDEQPDEVRKVLSVFVVDGRLTQIPASQGKRLVILDWLAQDFEPGERYSEPMVNLILGRRHPDTAALRRYLVDHDLLSREGGMYWRSGGTTPP
jgi:hypothetical protein